MKLHFLGTSAAIPSAARSHISFVLLGPRPILVECGPTTPWQLERAGVDPHRIADVFVSHVHGDHSLGLPMLLLLWLLEGTEAPPRVLCPVSAVQRLQTIFANCYPGQSDLVDRRIEWLGLAEEGSAERELAEGVRFSTAPGIHGVPELAIRFDIGERSVVYSGDTAPSDRVCDLARGASVLLHDATWSESIDGRTSPDHSSCRQAGGLASQARVGRLGLVHLHKSYLGREATLRAEAAETFGGEVFVPSDGDEIEI
jgi:ribonuclease Z